MFIFLQNACKDCKTPCTNLVGILHVKMSIFLQELQVCLVGGLTHMLSLLSTIGRIKDLNYKLYLLYFQLVERLVHPGAWTLDFGGII